MVELPLFALDVAVIVTVPAFFPVTSPLEFTLATGPSLLDQVKVALLTVFPLASNAVAES
jgi:hypothetical protein